MRLDLSFLVLVPVLALSVAAGLWSHLALADAASLIGVLQRRFSLRRRLEHVLAVAQQDEARGRSRQRGLSPPVLISLAIGLTLAIVWRHPVLSPWFVFFGGLVGWMLVSTQSRIRPDDFRDMEVLVSEVRGLYVAGQSIFGPLEVVAQDMPEGTLRAAIEEAVRRYRSGKPVDKSLDALVGVNSLLDRLVVILSHASRADDEAIHTALVDLETQIRRGRNLLNRSRVVMQTNFLALRVLQAVNLIALAVVTVAPGWRSYFGARPLGLVASTLVALLGSWYFASEMRRMEELA